MGGINMALDKTIITNRVLVHMMDVEHDQVLYSDGFVELNEMSLEYYDAKLKKAFSHTGLKEVEVGSLAPLVLRARNMIEDETQFLSLSRSITNEWFQVARLIEDMPNSNMLYIDCRYDGVQYLAILKLNYKYQAAMVKEPNDDGVEVMRITTRQMVPSKAANIEEAFLVNVEDSTVYMIEKRFMIDGKAAYYMNDQLLHGTIKLSERQKLKAMNDAIKEADETFHSFEEEPEVLIKKAMKNHLERLDDIKPVEIIEEIFVNDYEAQSAAVDALLDAGITKESVVNVAQSVEHFSRMRIITDTEMEIRLDVDDYLGHHNIEQIENEDGSISLVLSNIQEIVVK